MTAGVNMDSVIDGFALAFVLLLFIADFVIIGIDIYVRARKKARKLDKEQG